MTEDARQRIEELQKKRRGEFVRNALLIFTSVSTAVMALVLFFVLSQFKAATTVYVEEAQSAVKGACTAAEGRPLPEEVRKNCDAAERNELPQELQSAVDNPDPDDPENQDPELQDSEIQNSEIQESESQDPEIQDPENQDQESQESEINDPDPDDPETQDEEVQEGEIQESEVQDPEEQNAPACPSGYSQKTFRYYGPDGINNTGDEQDWLLCVKD